MSFEISKITNKDLRDIATIIDENNDGVISDGNETSIFLQKGQDLVNIGVVLKEDIVGQVVRIVNPKERRTKLSS